jgi:hypothetical protein
MGGGGPSRTREARENDDNALQFVPQQQQRHPSTHLVPQFQPPPPPTKVLVMNNDCTLHKPTLKIIQNRENKKEYSLTFTFDAICEVVISIFFNSKDKSDAMNDITSEIVPVDEKIQPKHLKFFPGRNIKYDEKLFKMDLSLYSSEQLKSTENSSYPLILRMEKNDPNKAESKIFYYYGIFVLEEQTYQLKIVREKMEWNGESYEVNEIYGISSSDFGGKSEAARMDDSDKECIVCLSDKRDTIILPCRHMCLCVGCAQSIQGQTSRKCPICRDNIESFLRLSKQAPAPTGPSPAQQAHLPNT